MIVVGLIDPRPHEIEAVRTGVIEHRLGRTPATMWMTIRSEVYGGDMYFSAAKQPQDFTDAKLAELREKLPSGQGLLCVLVLVNARDNCITAMRAYTWSHRLSHAFLDGCESTRGESESAADRDASNLMNHYSVEELAERAKVEFVLGS